MCSSDLVPSGWLVVTIAHQLLDPASPKVAAQTTFVPDLSHSWAIEKEDIQPIADALSTVSQLSGVGFKWKESQVPSFGLIAQDVEKIIPELVGSINDIKNINYDGIIPFLIEAIKQLKARVEELEKNH